jgi:hypothetical protein
VNITNSSIQLVGSSSIAPPPSLSTAAFAYNSSTFTATWTYAISLPLNKYQLSIPATAVTSKASGQQLDGEFTTGSSLLPSGDGTTGGNFNFRFNILPGDVEQHGTVTAQEAIDVRNHYLQFTTTPGYSVFMDTIAKGRITGLDYNNIVAAINTTLPAADPTPLVQPSAMLGAVGLVLASADLGQSAFVSPTVSTGFTGLPVPTLSLPAPITSSSPATIPSTTPTPAAAIVTTTLTSAPAPATGVLATPPLSTTAPASTTIASGQGARPLAASPGSRTMPGTTTLAPPADAATPNSAHATHGGAAGLDLAVLDSLFEAITDLLAFFRSM